VHVLCSIVGHTRNKRKVREIANVFASTCKWCGTPLIRKITETEWRTYDPAREPLPRHWEAMAGAREFQPRRQIEHRLHSSRSVVKLKTDKRGRVIRRPSSDN
jgi:uncharacterized Zn finger protein (UPF0148 family)